MKDYIFIEQPLNELKDQMNSSKKDLLVRLLTQCESYFSVDLPEEHPKSSSTYMGMAMANLALAYLLTEDDKYLTESKRWMMTTVNFPHWGNAHLVDVDLSAAWILFGLGICYDWLSESLSEEERKAVREKLLLQGTRMYDFKVETEGKGWSTNFWQNHNWINMTGLACAGYALSSEEESVKPWIETSKENFDFVFSVMPEDGSDYEGVVYWRYGAMWLFVYAHLVKEREGIDYFKSCSFLENTFFYRLYQAAPNLEEQINFGDAHDTRSGHSTAIYYKVASEYNNGYAQKMGDLVRTEFLEREASLSKVKPGILPECFFEVLFYNDKVEPKAFDDLPTTRFFDDLGLFVKRTSWDRDATHFSFKCSYPGGKKQWADLWKIKEEKNYNCFGLSHQHPDNNSFLINSGGQFFSIDDGYNREVRASHHNVIVVDDDIGYHDEGQNNVWRNFSIDMVPEVEKCIIEDGYSYVVGETAKVYDKSLNLKTFRRHVLNTDKPYYVLVDELESPDSHTYTWLMYSTVYPELQGNAYRYTVEGQKMDLYSFSDAEIAHEFKENTVRAVMTTQEPDKFTENNMKGLRISNKVKAPNVRFFTLLLPDPDKYQDLKVNEVKLDNGAMGIEVSYMDQSELFIHAPNGSFSYEGKIIEGKCAIITLNNKTVSKIVKL